MSGCATVGPDYLQPRTRTGSEWRNDLKHDPSAREADPQTLAVWWTTFNDPELNSLIERAVKGNLELKKARSRVREARARRMAAKGGLFPTLDASGTASQSRSSEETGSGKTVDLFTLGFDALWEVDLFGGGRRTVEAAEAALQANQEGQGDVLVSLLSEMVLNYTEVRTFQARLATAAKNLESQKETYQLTLWRNEAGLIDELAVQQARYTLENIRSQTPALRTGLEQAMNRIAVLLGEQPGEVHRELEGRKPLPVPPLELAVGVPADVLRRRPDIRRAERELAAQTARIGAAKAELYPKLKLSGSIGLEAFGLGNLFSLGSRTMTGGLGISWPIFHAGVLRQNVEIQSALQEQAFLSYEAAVLTALEETENALKSYAEEHSRYKSLKETIMAAEKVVNLTREKFQAGLTDFGQVLEAQLILWSFQDQRIISQGSLSSGLVRIYKALGGGWESWGLEEIK
ncbi:MAG: efflux transporter outer membrane subunit [Deltaproteobacteria bacterium]|nr:efflux transporter outer membrane subunit [Deltaproteobacteria bacterium]